MPSAFDAKATFRDRIGFEKLETEMPFFREGYKIKEKDRQEMLRVQESSDPYAAEVIARVFDDTRDLIDGANVVPERMIMQLLFPEGGEERHMCASRLIVTPASYGYAIWYFTRSGTGSFQRDSALWSSHLEYSGFIAAGPNHRGRS